MQKHVLKADFRYGLETGSREGEYIVVSMASYAARYPTIVPALKSLLLQTRKPHKIIVWLDEDTEENQPTSQMKNLEEYGVEFRFTADDLRPHKKYFYAMREFPEACVITVDDDLVYSEDMIASLMRYHKKYPDAVCARRVHQMTFDEENHLKPYQEWEYEYRVEGEPSHMLFATGGGGTLYPPGCLPEDAFDVRNIKRFCQNADDIWLKVMELLAHKKVVWVKNKYVMPLEVAHSQSLALNTGNVLEGHNDMYLERLMEVWADILDTMGVDHKI